METVESKDTFVWAIVELMGHLTLAGRLTKPGEFGGLWQIDIPEGEGIRSELFGSASVYRIRIVSEQIARAYGHETQVVEYDAPIVTRVEHQAAMDRKNETIEYQQRIIAELQQRLISVNQLPSKTISEENND